MSKIAIIIPCYNEGSRLDVKQIVSFLNRNKKIDVCFVNDGSSDNTDKVIVDAVSKCPEQITTLSLEKNSGKAEATRQGMLKMSNDDYEWLGYWDADLATPLAEIDHLLSYDNEKIKLLMCSRIKRLGALVKRHPVRHILGRIMATLISCVLRLPVYDTQCGAKFIRNSEIESVFNEEFHTKWLFDVEIIARIQQKFHKKEINDLILEVPVYTWVDIADSKLKFKHMLFSLFDIVRIYLKYRPSKKE